MLSWGWCMKANENTAAVYHFIRDYIKENGFAPTLREIGKECYLSRGAVIRHLDLLEAKGAIERDPGKARGMRLGPRPYRHRVRPKQPHRAI